MTATTVPRRASNLGVVGNDVDVVRVRLPPIPTFFRVDVISRVPIQVIRRHLQRRLSRQINGRRQNLGEEEKGDFFTSQTNRLRLSH